MKRFLFRVTLCFLILFMICTIPCWLFEKKARQCTDLEPYSRINMVDNMKDFDAEVVILGNSRVVEGYIAPILDSLTGKKWANLGISGFPFDVQYNLMYKRYIEQNKKPRVIILETSRIVSFNRFSHAYYIEMLPFVNLEGFQAYTDMYPEITIADNVMFIKYFGKLDLVLNELKKFYWYKKEIKPKKVNLETKQDTVQQDFIFNRAIVQTFCEFLDECAEDDVKPILVCSPICGDTTKYKLDVNKDCFWRNIRYYTSGKKVPILIYQGLYGNDTSYFRDIGHLNKYGAACFSAQLAHDLDSLGLLE